MTHDLRRRLIRIALAIERRLGANHPKLDELPHAAWQRCQRAHELLRDCQQLRWHAAGRRSSDRFRWALEELQRQLGASHGQAVRRPALAPTLRDLAADLLALEQEFGQVELDLQGRTVSVVTDPILLEGVELGPFEIQLAVDRLGSSAPYEIFGQGRAAEGDSQVIHPHVSGGRLCEGDAAAPLRAALQEGRLLDFFLIVAQTLRTYNGDSAYVRLEEWEGASCADCGCRVAECERTICERCGAEVCDDCFSSCAECDRWLCHSCTAVCPACGQAHCASCLQECSSCSDS